MDMPPRHVTIVLLLVAAVLGPAGRESGAQVPAQPAAAGLMDPEVAAGRVTQALRTTPGIPAGDVVVSTHADTVVLSGEVGSEVDVARAVAAAESASGGVRVSNQIAIRPDTDQAAQQQAMQLVRNVEQALRIDARTANLGVAVSVDEAQVIGLHGLVPDRESRAAAEEVAARAAGATRLRSHLVVPGE
jgi:osmotically-inducible protein OsmY